MLKPSPHLFLKLRPQSPRGHSSHHRSVGLSPFSFSSLILRTAVGHQPGSLWLLINPFMWLTRPSWLLPHSVIYPPPPHSSSHRAPAWGSGTHRLCWAVCSLSSLQALSDKLLHTLQASTDFPPFPRGRLSRAPVKWGYLQCSAHTVVTGLN